MKKLFIVLASVIVLISCEEKEEETTYQIINNVSVESSEIDYLNGSLYEVVVFKYVGDDLAGEDNFDQVNANGGYTGKIILDTKVEKIKVSFKYLPEESPLYGSPENNRNYTASFLFIEKEKNNKFIIDNNTMVKSSLKSGETRLIDLLNTVN